MTAVQILERLDKLTWCDQAIIALLEPGGLLKEDERGHLATLMQTLADMRCELMEQLEKLCK